MEFVAYMCTPGYMPDSLPLDFESTAEAWTWLADERHADLVSVLADPDACPVLAELRLRASQGADCGTVGGYTPGYDGQHDLGVNYVVDYDSAPIAGKEPE